MKISALLLRFYLLILPMIVSTASTFYTMPQASSDEDSEDSSASKATTPTKQATKKPAADTTADVDSAVPSTQLTTIELEKDSGKTIVKVSHEKNIEEFSRLFDEAKKVHAEMSEILSNLEEMRTNLVQSFQDAAHKLDPILQDVSFQAGKISNNTLPTLKQSSEEQGRKK